MKYDAENIIGPERIERLAFFVPGTPVQQGSKTVFRNRPVDANAKTLKPWRKKVTETAKAELAGRAGFAKDAAIVVLYTFYLKLPKTVKRREPNVRPDLDKLERAIGDALTDAGVWVDDGQVVVSHTAKEYADFPGVKIVVTELA